MMNIFIALLGCLLISDFIKANHVLVEEVDFYSKLRNILNESTIITQAKCLQYTSCETCTKNIDCMWVNQPSKIRLTKKNSTEMLIDYWGNNGTTYCLKYESFFESALGTVQQSEVTKSMEITNGTYWKERNVYYNISNDYLVQENITDCFEGYYNSSMENVTHCYNSSTFEECPPLNQSMCDFCNSTMENITVWIEPYCTWHLENVTHTNITTLFNITYDALLDDFILEMNFRIDHLSWLFCFFSAVFWTGPSVLIIVGIVVVVVLFILFCCCYCCCASMLKKRQERLRRDKVRKLDEEMEMEKEKYLKIWDEQTKTGDDKPENKESKKDVELNDTPAPPMDDDIPPPPIDDDIPPPPMDDDTPAPPVDDDIPAPPIDDDIPPPIDETPKNPIEESSSKVEEDIPLPPIENNIENKNDDVPPPPMEEKEEKPVLKEDDSFEAERIEIEKQKKKQEEEVKRKEEELRKELEELERLEKEQNESIEKQEKQIQKLQRTMSNSNVKV